MFNTQNNLNEKVCVHGIVPVAVGNGCYTWCVRCSIDEASGRDAEMDGIFARTIERYRVRTEDAERALVKAAARVTELEATNILLRNENVRLSNKGGK